MAKYNLAQFTEDTELLRKVIRYWVAECPFEVGRTVLVKLIYLSDVAFYQRFGRKLTGTSYRFDNYGPFNWNIIDESVALVDVGFIDQKASVNHFGGDKYIYKTQPEVEKPEFDPMTEEVLKGVRQLVEELGNSKELLNYVYSTEPLSSTNKGAYINFEMLRDDGGVEGISRRSLQGSVVLRRARARIQLPKIVEAQADDVMFAPDAEYLAAQAVIEDEILGFVPDVDCLESELDE